MPEVQKKPDETGNIEKQLGDMSLRNDKTDESPPPKDDKVDVCTATALDLVKIGLPLCLAEKIVKTKFETFKEIREFILKDGEEQFQKIKDNCRLHLNSKDIFFHSESLLKIMHKSTLSNCEVKFDKSYSQLPQSDDQLLLMHVNIDGLKTNKDKLEAFGQLPDVICLTEVNKNEKVTIEGYECKVYTEPSTKDPTKDDDKKFPNGGAAIYLKKNSEKFDSLTEESHSETIKHEKCMTIYESAWVTLKRKTERLDQKTIIIGAIYRHPQNNMSENSLEGFREYLQKKLKILKTGHSLVYILGDFNIDLLNEEKFKKTKLFYDSICSDLGYKLLISQPTRHTYPSTLIDHIYTNDEDENIRSGVLYDCSFSHHPVYCIV